MLPADQPIRYFRFSQSSDWETVDARIITETTVSLSVNGEEWLSFACTPTDLEALGAGFLFNEGLIQGSDEIGAITICQQGTNIDIWLRHTVEKPTHWQRTSGCTGGMTTMSPAHSLSASAMEPCSIAPQELLNSMEQLSRAQGLYHEAGGVHCSALFNGKAICFYAEDIGRHNTLDKLAGLLLLNHAQVQPLIVLTTGRISSEMLQKSARMGAAAVVSRTSPTSLSTALAEQLGITIIGYARRSQFSVYTHPERIGLGIPTKNDVPASKG